MMARLFKLLPCLRGGGPWGEGWKGREGMGHNLHFYKTQKKRDEQICSSRSVADREGFEPPVPLSTAVFKTAVIDHSTTFPNSFGGGLPFKSDAKVLRLFESCKLSGIFLRKKYKNSIFAPEKAERKGQKQTFPCKKGSNQSDICLRNLNMTYI